MDSSPNIKSNQRQSNLGRSSNSNPKPIQVVIPLQKPKFNLRPECDFGRRNIQTRNFKTIHDIVIHDDLPPPIQKLSQIVALKISELKLPPQNDYCVVPVRSQNNKKQESPPQSPRPPPQLLSKPEGKTSKIIPIVIGAAVAVSTLSAAAGGIYYYYISHLAKVIPKSGSLVKGSKPLLEIKKFQVQKPEVKKSETDNKGKMVCQKGFIQYQGKCLRCPKGSAWNGKNCIKNRKQQKPKQKQQRHKQQKQKQEKQKQQDSEGFYPYELEQMIHRAYNPSIPIFRFRPSHNNSPHTPPQSHLSYTLL